MNKKKNCLLVCLFFLLVGCPTEPIIGDKISDDFRLAKQNTYSSDGTLNNYRTYEYDNNNNLTKSKFLRF